MSAVPSTIPLVPVEGEFLQGRAKRQSVNGMAKRSVGAKDSARAFNKTQWPKLLGLISDGLSVKDSMTAAKISRAQLEGSLRTDVKMAEQYKNAKLSAIRKRWDIDTLELMFAEVAGGKTVQQACDAVFRDDEIHNFYRLILGDKSIRAMYDDARTIQAEKMALDDLIELADDKADDLTEEGRANSANVNRSRLQVETRKWIAGRLNFKRFGDKQQVDLEANIVVDHAARLEAARKRKEEAHKNPNRRNENDDSI